MPMKTNSLSSTPGLPGFMRSLRSHLGKKYPQGYVVGTLYHNEASITYFPFTPVALKQQKLKVAIVFNHGLQRFEVWLAGQNRQVQKAYRAVFTTWDAQGYRVPSPSETGYAIVDAVLVENPDLSDARSLMDDLERKVLSFVVAVSNMLP